MTSRLVRYYAPMYPFSLMLSLFVLIGFLPYPYSYDPYFTRVTPQGQDKKTIAIRQTTSTRAHVLVVAEG